MLLYTGTVRKKFLLFVASILVSLIFTTRVQAAVSWSETQPAGDADHPWTPVAMSSDGEIIIAGSQNGGLYLSENGGDTWAETQPAGTDPLNWYPISMSSNGQTILAGILNTRLYLTTNGGDTWAEAQPGGDNDLAWYSSSMSSDGQYILALVRNGRAYRSNDGGTGWVETDPVGTSDQPWSSSAMSSSGQIMFAVMNAGRLYRSTDYGLAWGEVQPAGDTDVQWNALGVSSDGQIVLAAALNGRIYRSSDGGDSWGEIQPAGDGEFSWSFTSVSSDGSTMFVSSGTRLYISSNGGDSWSETQPLGDSDYSWSGGSMSSDSQVLVAGVYNGRIFLGSNPPPPPSSNNSVYHPPAGFGPPSCNDSAPSAIPDLFRTDVAGTYVNLYFSTVSGGSGYNVSYGLNSEANQYGDNFGYSGNLWTIGRTISGLQPNTTYYFKVQSVNGCNAGGWSAVKSVKTKGRTANVSKWFANLDPFSSNPTLITAKSSGSAVAGVSKSPESCSYTVQEGDSFWRIAEKELRRGSRFGELVGLNSGVSVLQIGQIVSICK